MTDFDNHDLLFETLLNLKTIEDYRLFFTDLCTPKELDSMVQRITAAKMLISGKNYEQIISETDISSATLARISRCVKYGKGYKTLLK
jgi:TrpR-related protein YerC/YecD